MDKSEKSEKSVQGKQVPRTLNPKEEAKNAGMPEHYFLNFS